MFEKIREKTNILLSRWQVKTGLVSGNPLYGTVNVYGDLTIDKPPVTMKEDWSQANSQQIT